MQVQLFADPAYIVECIGEDREVFYVDIGGIDHGIPRMVMRTSGRESGIKVGFFRDDGLVEVPLHHVFASRRMAEIFRGECEEKVRVRNARPMYVGEDGNLVGVEDLDEAPRVRVDIEEVPDPILGATYRRAEPVVAESDDSLPGEVPSVDFIKVGAMDTECRGPQTILYGTHCLNVAGCRSPNRSEACRDTRKLVDSFHRLPGDPVDYDRTARTIEEMRQASMELGFPIVTAEQGIRGVMVDKSKATIEEPILKRFPRNWYTKEDWDRLAMAAKREEEDE
jgi:hypothetical protein